MIKHIVWWTLKEEAENATAAENAAKMIAMGDGLRGEIPALLSIEMTTNILSTSTVEAEVVLQTTHNTAEDLKAYAEDPKHVLLGEFAKKVVKTRAAIDYEI